MKLTPSQRKRNSSTRERLEKQRKLNREYVSELESRIERIESEIPLVSIHESNPITGRLVEELGKDYDYDQPYLDLEQSVYGFSVDIFLSGEYCLSTFSHKNCVRCKKYMVDRKKRSNACERCILKYYKDQLKQIVRV